MTEPSIFNWKNTSILLVIALLLNVVISNPVAYFKGLLGSTGSSLHDTSVEHYVRNLEAPVSNEDALKYCPITDAMKPSDSDKSFAYFASQEFRDIALKTLIGAVNIPTEAFDDMKAVGEDPRWEVFFKFEEFLKTTFPQLHKDLTLDHVNTHGLVYTWEGSNPSLKPIMLAAHQDVVPVLNDTRDQWTHDPYQAYYDGAVLWGRGSADDKSPLIGILQAIEYILKNEPDYKPTRTVVVALGFDEEINGHYGARNIGKFLLEKYGENSFEAIIDEGGQGVHNYKGLNVVIPGLAEKGYLNLKISAHAHGGHSSLPPDHTAIGLISAIGKEIEDTPFSPILTNNHNPFFKFLKCIAARSPELEDNIRQVVYRADQGDKTALSLITKYLAKNRITKYSVQTSQALDTIMGGMKVNALPEQVSLVTNFRISVDSNGTAVKDKILSNVKNIASQYGVGVYTNFTSEPYTEIMSKTAAGYFVVEDFGNSIEPSKVSDSTGYTWEVFSGTLRHVYQAFAGPIVNPLDPKNNGIEAGHLNTNYNKMVVVAPGLMSANTDTQHYWGLTDNIYRFTPMRLFNTSISNLHTVDEYMLLDSHLETIALYYSYIKNYQK